MGADLIEIRLDYLNKIKGIQQIVKSTSLPLIATNRQYKQGGRRLQKEEQRLQTLLDAADLDFQYIDIDLTTESLNSVVSELKEKGTNIIISFHDFKRTPKTPKLEKIMRSQIEAGADICKLVTTAKMVNDNTSCLLLTSKMSKVTKMVCFAMGERGLLSRVLSPIFGASFTYASVKKGLETALGQPTIFELKELFRSLGVEN